MNRNQVAAKVAAYKEKHPERYCPAKRCLWATGGGYCPRHAPHVIQTGQEASK